MKARKVKGLDPDRPLGRNAARMMAVRLDEVCSFAPAARNPGGADAQHDMRIATKRLRYLLELMQPCFGDTSKEAIKAAKRLQDVLGEIHDCDQMLPRAHAHLARLREADARAVSAEADGASDLEPDTVRSAPNRARYRGVESLVTYLTARRNVLHSRFLAELERLKRSELAERLTDEVTGATS